MRVTSLLSRCCTTTSVMWSLYAYLHRATCTVHSHTYNNAHFIAFYLCTSTCKCMQVFQTPHILVDHTGLYRGHGQCWRGGYSRQCCHPDTPLPAVQTYAQCHDVFMHMLHVHVHVHCTLPMESRTKISTPYRYKYQYTNWQTTTLVWAWSGRGLQHHTHDSFSSAGLCTGANRTPSLEYSDAWMVWGTEDSWSSLWERAERRGWRGERTFLLEPPIRAKSPLVK